MPPKNVYTRQQWAPPSDPKAHSALRALRAQSNKLNALEDRPKDDNPWSNALDAQETLEALAEAKSRARQQLAKKGGPPRAPRRGVYDKQQEGSVRNTDSKILKIPGGVLYVGDVKNGRPHGHGDLILKDGTTHRGEFREGRAHGDGILYGRTGTVHQGTWSENRRMGAFWMLDSKGKEWEEEYGLDGKRVSRVPLSTETALSPAEVCAHCSSKFHETFSIRRCKQHKAEWKSFADPDFTTFPEGGMWMCCGEKRFEEGVTCTFGMHSSATPRSAQDISLNTPHSLNGVPDFGGLPGNNFGMPGGGSSNDEPPSEMDQLHALGDKKYGKPRSGRIR